MKYDYLIVGAGLAGSILAERIASVLGKHVLLIDRREHIGGNCYDYKDENGIQIHKYGPHLFHTNNRGIVDYLSKFTKWRKYEYRVLSSVNGEMVPMPINRKTINILFQANCDTDEEADAFLKVEKVKINNIFNSEDYVLSRVGHRLYELLYKNYTTKQWGIGPKLLLPSVCGRIPVRTSLDDRYFDDTFQIIPSDGYTELFRSMINHPNIELKLNCEFKDIQSGTFEKLIYTGLIDEYFHYKHGKLPYRSLNFKYDLYDLEYRQPVASIHYPNEFQYTRTTEYKHITGQINSKTVVSTEYPSSEGEPYYPIPTADNIKLYEKYKSEAVMQGSTEFVGRMASYQYYNMDQVVAQSLKLFEKIASEQ
jgi:UDP-galactopyranose mutase